jgi:hypothetical protein
MKQLIAAPNCMRPISIRLIHAFFGLFLATAALGADTNTAPNLAARLNKACAEKKIDDRLNALADVAKT